MSTRMLLEAGNLSFGTPQVIGDDQLHPGQAASAQAAQEAGPKRTVLTVSHLDPQHLAVAGRCDSVATTIARDTEGPTPGPGGRSRRQRRREVDVIEAPGPESFQVLVQLRADPAHLALGDSGADSQRLDQVVDLPSGDSIGPFCRTSRLG